MVTRSNLWRNHDYVGWLAGQTLSAVGTSLSTFAYPLLILFTTGSAAKTGIVAAAANIGSLLTLLAGGVVADRYSRRLVLIGGALVQAVVVGSVGFAVLAGHVLLAHVALAGLVDGAVVGVTLGAERATLRRVVPAADYATATSQMWGRDMAIRVIGPPLAGVLFSVGRWLPFLADAASYTAGVAGVTAVRRPLGPDPDESDEREPLRKSITVGFRFLRDNAYLRFTAWWSGAMNMLATGLTLLVVLLVRSEGGDARVIGGVQALAMTGALVGALASGRLLRRMGGRLMVVALSWSLGLACFAMAVVGSPWGVGAIQAVVLLVIVPVNVVMETYEMQLIPDALVGRVSNTITLAANGLRWTAPLVVGFVVQASSPKTALVIWGGAFLMVAALVQFNRSLRVLDEPVESVAAAAATPAG